MLYDLTDITQPIKEIIKEKAVPQTCGLLFQLAKKNRAKFALSLIVFETR